MVISSTSRWLVWTSRWLKFPRSCHWRLLIVAGLLRFVVVLKWWFQGPRCESSKWLFPDLEVAGFGLRVFWFQKLEVGTRGGWRDLEVGLKDLEVNPDLRLRIFAKSFESLLGFHHPFRLFVSETRSGWFRDFEWWFKHLEVDPWMLLRSCWLGWNLMLGDFDLGRCWNFRTEQIAWDISGFETLHWKSYPDLFVSAFYQLRILPCGFPKHTCQMEKIIPSHYHVFANYFCFLALTKMENCNLQNISFSKFV